MTIGYMIFLGIMLCLAILYAIIGGGTLWLFVWMGIVAISIFATQCMNSSHKDQFDRSFFNKFKPHQCEWCNQGFWTRKGWMEHEKKTHPIQRRDRINYHRAMKHSNLGLKIHNPDDYLKPCTWCGGTGYKYGVMCDECGGTGKMIR